MQCSATATTVASSVTATTTSFVNILCSGDTCGCLECALDGDDDDSSLAPRAGRPVERRKKKREGYRPKMAPNRNSQPSPGKWATPENYDNDVHRFIRGEVALSFRAGTSVGETPGVLGAYVLRWGNEPTQISVQGLCGCTVIVIASRRGALVYHIWEDPFFGSWDAATRRIVAAPDAVMSAAFGQLRYKNPQALDQMAGILNLRSQHKHFQPLNSLGAEYHDLFNNDAYPQVTTQN